MKHTHFESTYFFSFLALFKSTPYNPHTVSANANCTNLKKRSRTCIHEIFILSLIVLNMLITMLAFFIFLNWMELFDVGGGRVGEVQEEVDDESFRRFGRWGIVVAVDREWWDWFVGRPP